MTNPKFEFCREFGLFARSTIKDRKRTSNAQNRSSFVFLTKIPRQGCPREGRWKNGPADLAPHSQLLSIGNWTVEKRIKNKL